MTIRSIKHSIYWLLILLLLPHTGFAASAVATVSVTVARFLSITNTSSLEFGVVSVSAMAGSVTIDTNGMRFTTGGVTINPTGLFTPAKFIIEGRPDSNFSLKLPDRVELRDANGNTIQVEKFQTSHATGNLDSNGTLEITVGGKINLDANQQTGDYNGVMVVELNYS